MKDRWHIKGISLLFATAIVLGFSFAVRKIGLQSVDIFTFNAIRFIIGGICIIPVCLISGFLDDTIDVKGSIITGVLLGIILTVIVNLQLIGLKESSSAKAGIITLLYIVFVPIFNLFKGKKISWFTLLALLIGLVGFYELSGCREKGLGRMGYEDMLLFLSALLFALYFFIITQFSEKYSNVIMTCSAFLTSGVLCFVLMRIYEAPDLTDILSAGMPILYSGIICCMICFALNNTIIKKMNLFLVTAILSIEPIFVVLSGFWFLGERLNIYEITGCVIIFVGVALSVLTNLDNGGVKVL